MSGQSKKSDGVSVVVIDFELTPREHIGTDILYVYKDEHKYDGLGTTITRRRINGMKDGLLSWRVIGNIVRLWRVMHGYSDRDGPDGADSARTGSKARPRKGKAGPSARGV